MVLKRADFEPKLGNIFNFYNEGNVHPASLVEVSENTNSLREGGGFSLLFECKLQEPYSQGIYQLTSDNFDEHLFMVPVFGDGKIVQYEVVFN